MKLIEKLNYTHSNTNVSLQVKIEEDSTGFHVTVYSDHVTVYQDNEALYKR